MLSASRFKCDVTISGGRCLSQLFREMFPYSLALNIARNTRVRLARVFDVGTRAARHKTNIICVEVDRVHSCYIRVFDPAVLEAMRRIASDLGGIASWPAKSQQHFVVRW